MSETVDDINNVNVSLTTMPQEIHCFFKTLITLFTFFKFLKENLANFDLFE
jgi:hypothetical protein